jgi:hypothetical protein
VIVCGVQEPEVLLHASDCPFEGAVMVTARPLDFRNGIRARCSRYVARKRWRAGLEHPGISRSAGVSIRARGGSVIERCLAHDASAGSVAHSKWLRGYGAAEVQVLGLSPQIQLCLRRADEKRR